MGGSVDKRAAARQEAIEWVQRLCAAVRQAVDGDRVIAWLYDAPRQAVSPLGIDSPSGIDELPAEWETIPLARMPAAVSVLIQGRPVEIDAYFTLHRLHTSGVRLLEVAGKHAGEPPSPINRHVDEEVDAHAVLTEEDRLCR